MTLTELLMTALTMLIGQEGEDFSYYIQDKTWWDTRLWMVRN